MTESKVFKRCQSYGMPWHMLDRSTERQLEQNLGRHQINLETPDISSDRT
jgi:hypothetical protein